MILLINSKATNKYTFCAHIEHRMGTKSPPCVLVLLIWSKNTNLRIITFIYARIFEHIFNPFGD